MDDLKIFKEKSQYSFKAFEKTFNRIFPDEKENRRVVTLSEYVLRKSHVTRDEYLFMNALQTAIKAIAWKISRYPLHSVGKESVHHHDYLSHSSVQISFEKKLEELFIDIMGSNDMIGYMISKHTEDIIKIDGNVRKNYLLSFNVLNGKHNLNDHLPVGSTFALYDLTDKEELDLRNLTGNTIITSGFAIYGTCNLLIVAFKGNQGVHGFYLDQSVGEYTLHEEDKLIPRRGVCYSVNEGLTAGWDQATQIFVNRRKDPRIGIPNQSFYLGSLCSDVIRILRTGGIVLYPANIKYPEGKMGTIYECHPLAYVIRQCGGYASDGWISTLDLRPETPHHKSPFFGGSIEDVLSLMELKSIYKAKSHF